MCAKYENLVFRNGEKWTINPKGRIMDQMEPAIRYNQFEASFKIMKVGGDIMIGMVTENYPLESKNGYDNNYFRQHGSKFKDGFHGWSWYSNTHRGNSHSLRYSSAIMDIGNFCEPFELGDTVRMIVNKPSGTISYAVTRSQKLKSGRKDMTEKMFYSKIRFPERLHLCVSVYMSKVELVNFVVKGLNFEMNKKDEEERIEMIVEDFSEFRVKLSSDSFQICKFFMRL